MFAASRQIQDEYHPGVDPLQVAAYLLGRGWKEMHHEPDRSSTWILKSQDALQDSFYEILLPLRTDFRDYPRRIEELLDVLVRAEGRAREEILQSFSVTNADVIHLRVIGENSADGSIPLSQAVRLSQGAWDLLQAAACAAVAPRAAYSTRKPDRVREYLEQARVGQTQRGSYVVTIISPVHPHLFSLSESPHTEPFERRVLRFLLGGVQAARSAASEAASMNSPAPFEAAVERGVSANLCEAIADLVEVGGDGFEIGCLWSPSRRPSEGVPQRVAASRGIEPYMRAAAAAFRANTPIEDAEVRGFVEKVSRRKGAVRGAVTIVGAVNDQPRRVETILTGDTYKRAVAAHKEEAHIVCYGTLQRQGRGYILENPHGFELEPF